jgi:hypothetical protein
LHDHRISDEHLGLLDRREDVMDRARPDESLADSYRREGYDVVLQPSGSDLPTFLEGLKIDLLARNGGHFLAHTSDGQDAEGTLRVISASIPDDYSASLLAEASRLLRPDTIRAALVIGWSALEAASRERLAREGRASEKLTSHAIVDALLASDLISELEFQRLREGLNLRNIVVHGACAPIRPEIVDLLLNVASRLAVTPARHDGEAPGGEGASATIFRARFHSLPWLTMLTERAMVVLHEILGTSRGLVSEVWDLAEDVQGRPVVTLTLSDFTGIVAAVFTPTELEDSGLVRSRLNRLWGELLQIRSHKQLERMTKSLFEAG